MDNSGKKECATCFFTDDFPGVSIGEDGRCNFCTSDEFARDSRAQTDSEISELHKIAEELKRDRQGKYDCIIGASGGLDSSYVIYVARKVLGLNPLIVRYDNGFCYDFAVENLETMCRNLELDFITVRSRRGYDKKYIKYMVKALRHMGAFYGVCQYCHYILPTVVYRYALKENISAILTNYNIYENRLYLNRRFKVDFMKRRLRQGGYWRLPGMIFNITRAMYYFLRLKLEFYLPPISNLLTLFPRRPESIREVHITKYVRWDINKMVEELERETGWKHPPYPHLPMRFDCQINHSLGSMTYFNATGLVDQAVIGNNFIFDGVRTKDQLAERIEGHKKDLSENMKLIMKKLGLD
jgi:hypothetical protein